MSFNRHELIGKYQQGSVFIALCGENMKLITSIGTDPLGLGRWNWVQMECNGRKIRMITAY